MFIAMNRFRVNPERVEEFEQIWLERETHLQGLPGFIEFHMLRGPEKEDHVLYASHTVWRSREDFEAWTHSEAFRAAHANAGQSRREGLYLGPPTFEGFEVIQTINNEDNDMSNKEAYEQKLQAKLDEWQAEIDKLRAQAKGAEADARLENEKEAERLEAKREELRQKLDELRNSSDDAWNDIKAGAERAWASLSESLEKARSRFK